MAKVPKSRRGPKKARAARAVRAAKRAGVDRQMVERGVRLILEGIGEDTSRAGLRATPERVCDFYEELLAGMWQNPAEHLEPIKADHEHDLVIVKSIRFTSMCEHHLLPFMGTVGVAYVPRAGRIVGISKIVRAVDAIAGRLQIQERMTAEIADAIARELRPSGVFVVVEAEHLCMTVRGVRKPGASIVTTEARGVLRQPARQTAVMASLAR